jgi:plastocyanin
MTRMDLLRSALIATVLLLAGAARAEDPVVTITIKNHRFDPETVQIAAGQKVKLVIRNLDATAEEFDSDDLHREKVIPGGREGVVFIGPLKAGTYKFIGEYNAATARGQVVVK